MLECCRAIIKSCWADFSSKRISSSWSWPDNTHLLCVTWEGNLWRQCLRGNLKQRIVYTYAVLITIVLKSKSILENIVKNWILATLGCYCTVKLDYNINIVWIFFHVFICLILFLNRLLIYFHFNLYHQWMRASN